MCNKPYPDLIRKKSEKNVTTHGYKKYPWSLCSSKILRIQPITRAVSDLSSYDMVEWPEEIMHTTHRIDAKNVITDAALAQRKLSWRPSSSRYYWESHSGSERREKFLKKT